MGGDEIADEGGGGGGDGSRGDVGGDDVGSNGGVNSLTDEVGLAGELEGVVEHKCGGEDGGQRIGDVLACSLGERPVNGFKDRGVYADGSGREHAE